MSIINIVEQAEDSRDTVVVVPREVNNMNAISLTLKHGNTIMVESVSDTVIGLNADSDYFSELVDLISSGEFESYSTDDVTSNNNELIGISATSQEDGSFYYMLAFEKQHQDDTEALRRQIAELLAENQELKDYADVGKIMLGEET